jgi:hypothetical protein
VQGIGDECEPHAQMHEHRRGVRRSMPSMPAGLRGGAGSGRVKDQSGEADSRRRFHLNRPIQIVERWPTPAPPASVSTAPELALLTLAVAVGFNREFTFRGPATYDGVRSGKQLIAREGDAWVSRSALLPA